MNLERTLSQIRHLPRDQQQKVADFVSALSSSLVKEPESTKEVRASFSDGPFFGIWHDHPEMSDSTNWVRTLREREWGGRRPN